MIGKTISHYKILEKLGEGGMGVVYKAEDTNLKRTVALKFLPPELTRDTEAKQRFIQEAQAASALQYNNVATIHEINETEDGQMFICMDCYEGEILKDKIQRCPLKVEEAISIAIQVAKGLKKAHEKDIVHRDIKPANIFITEDGVVKILDFGLAKLAGPTQLTKTGTTLGTVFYISPEQAKGEKVDHRTDIWSLGVVLYEMITGRRPFEGDYEQAVIYSILNEESDPITGLRTGVPMELERIVQKAITKNADERYQNIGDMLVDLTVLQRQLGVEEIGPSRSASKSPNKNRIPIYAMSALLLSLLAFILGKQILFLSGSIEKTIAVLPLVNLMGDQEQQYFVDGMTEELIGKLSRVRALRVPARTSVLQYAGTQKDVKEIGKELGVGYIVEGSVRRADTSLRVSVTLSDVSTGFTLWSEDFDGEFKDVFAVQEETALKIVESLDLRLNREESLSIRKQPTWIPEAYDACLRGWTLLENYYIPEYQEQFDRAKLHFEKALEYDPDYPLALSGLAQIMVLRVFLGIDTSSSSLDRAEALVRSALDLDPNLSEAYNVLGDLWGTKQEWDQAADAYLKAIKLDPNNDYAWEELAWVYNVRNEPIDAEQAARTAIRINPANVWHHYQLGWALRSQKRLDEAIEVFEHSLQLNPKFEWAQSSLGYLYYNQGNYRASLTHYQKANELVETPGKMARIAAAYAGIGDKEQALDQLEKALEKGYTNFVFLDTTAAFNSLRDDPRFDKLLKTYRTTKEQ
jgi:serine/threonine protein kinase/Tfp pilus assembly protein PilF